MQTHLCRVIHQFDYVCTSCNMAFSTTGEFIEIPTCPKCGVKLPATRPSDDVPPGERWHLTTILKELTTENAKLKEQLALAT